jgi:hypothetical protein
VDGPLSVSKSGKKSLLPIQPFAYGSRLKNQALGSGVCIYTKPGVISSISALCSSLAGADGILGYGGACRGGDAPVPLHLQCVYGLFAVPVDKAGRCPFNLCEPLPDVFQSQPSSC